ncbi:MULTISPECIES: replication initiation protein [unclassified Corynebacterium]|uniref:replication initiation protein n=1 Tax=unclassified Corynebacterium TaxID=2624378 RepID=UPI001D0E0BF8|nr:MULTISPECIES: replication initiation protein [unclassified Corynebacterium]
MYRTDSEQLRRCQYVKLAHPQYAAVLVVDVDQPGSAGGHPSNLNTYVRDVVRSLVEHGIGPAWVGINPESGKAQMIWLIDPVYADKAGSSSQMKLLAATSRVLGGLLDGDPHFAHGFSRSPFYTGKAPGAYRWYPQHHRVMRLGDLVKNARDLAGLDPHGTTPAQKQFSSGRELIEAVKARREEAEAFRALAKDVESELAGDLDRYDPELIDGVRIRWISQGVAARDETAFRHALKVGHRLRARGERLTDAAIIDAYEHAYEVAQVHGGAGRVREVPPMRDRLTMARRVRCYVTQSSRKASYGASGGAERATSGQRKALSTMGRRGGQKAAERWKDRNSDYAQGQLKTLHAANAKRGANGELLETRVKALILDARVQGTPEPTTKEIAQQFKVSVSRVQQVRRTIGMTAVRGRPRKA